jgi:hypothetical protein
MEKKLSKTEKIKRLRAIKKWLKTIHWGQDFMCHFYEDNYKTELFIDIPELWKFRPKNELVKTIKDAWIFGDALELSPTHKQQAIDKAIKLIQSK